MNCPDPGENPQEEAWLLDWLEPELPELPAYAITLVEHLGRTAEPEGVG